MIERKFPLPIGWHSPLLQCLKDPIHIVLFLARSGEKPPKSYTKKAHRAVVFLDPGTWTLNPGARIVRTTYVDIRTTHVDQLIGVEVGGFIP